MAHRVSGDEYLNTHRGFIMPKDNVVWANPGALGLAAFGFNTILLQIHNIGWIPNTMPLIWGFFWGGMAQVIAGIIDARRGDTFGLTAFTSFGVFWIGLAFAFLLEWLGIVTLSATGLAWTMTSWCVFTGYMTIGTFRISRVHVFIFTSLTILFGLLAGHFFGFVSAHVAGIEGILVGAAAVYGSAAVIMNAQYKRWVLPIGLFPKPSESKEAYPLRLPEPSTAEETLAVKQIGEILRGVNDVEEIAEIERLINKAKGKVLVEPTSGFWEGKTPCWEMFRCPETMRNECPAFKYQTLPCWQIEGTYRKLADYGQRGDGTEICENCRVYKRWGQGERIEIKLRGKGFDATPKEALK